MSAFEIFGWAGWDHAQQSLALSQLIAWREADGWPDERFVPLVAGLAELQPWLDQWHGEIDPQPTASASPPSAASSSPLAPRRSPRLSTNLPNGARRQLARPAAHEPVIRSLLYKRNGGSALRFSQRYC